jgi:hypothetical protein
VGSCPSSTFQINGVCQGCQEPCDQCINSSTTCTSCKRGYLANNTCLEKCVNGYYAADTR